MSRKASISVIQLLFPLLLALPFPFAFMNCARESAPTGGPIDTIAPYVVFERPENNMQQANPQKIVVKFNEHIGLENIEDNCMISPIMEERPTISVKKKKMVIDLRKQTLQPNTTYSFNFNNAIKDLTEKNFAEQYSYAFSTGVGIDSMKMAGSVSYAETGTVPEKAYVLLYDNLSDTAFKTQKPRYVTQISKRGKFSFSNIEAKPYRIYALEDSDKDFTYNQVSEKIAFLDTIFNPTAESYIDTAWFTHKDTTRFDDFPDSILVTEVTDSFKLVTKTRWSDQDISLVMFKNDVWNQEILTSKRISKYGVSYKLAAHDLFPTDIQISPAGTFQKEEVGHDSLVVWLLDTALQNCDSAKAIMLYPRNVRDNTTATDTLMIEAIKDMPERLKISSSLDGNKKVFAGDTVFITLSRPIQTSELSSIKLYESCDTSKSTCEELNPATHYHFTPKYHYAEQSILKYKDASDRFALYFSKPISPNDVKVTLDGMPNLSDWYYCERDEKSNALLYWIHNSEALRLKNPAITVTYVDEHGENVTQNFNLKKEVPVQKKYKMPTSNKRLILQMTEAQQEGLLYNDPIRIYCNNPIRSFTDSLFSLVNTEDTLEISAITGITCISPRILEIRHSVKSGESYELSLGRGAIVDTFGVLSREFVSDVKVSPLNNSFVSTIPYSITPIEERTFAITADWKTSMSYSLIIPDTTFTDVFGDANDSIAYSFQSPKLEGYGNLLIKNTQGLPSQNVIFILLSTDEKSSDMYVANRCAEGFRFENVPAGTYTLQCYEDANQNNKWDSGCIEIKRQPEKKYFFKEQVTVKAEWENSVFWEVFETK